MAHPERTEPKIATDAAASTSAVADFERALGELESIVTRLEGGALSLDDSLKDFERGVALFRQCQGALDYAEQRVHLLLDPANPSSASPFAPDRG